MAPALTRSLFVSGHQCLKQLWWKVHEPDAVELQPDKVLQDLFDQGRQVGEIARYERSAHFEKNQLGKFCAKTATNR